MKIKSLTIILILLKFLNSDEWLVVTGADEPVYAHAGEDVTLSCSVDTHVNVTELQVEWKKAEDDGDIMVLQYIEGKNRPDSQDGRYSARAEFFTEEIPKGNFSMKLRKVRPEDKGEFRCEVNTDTDSDSTTARIAVVGYSSWIWGILVLCFAVIPVVILTVALLVRRYLKESESRQVVCCGQCRGQYREQCRKQCCEQCREHCREQCRRLCCEWLRVAVPAGIVCIAFILWGVTEGSREVAVTCAAISLLNILVLFIMDPDRLYPGMSQRFRSLTQSTAVTIIIMAICIISVIEFLTKYSASTAEKTELKVFVGLFVFLMVLMASVQISFYFIWTWVFEAFWTTLRKRLRRTICALAIGLIFMVLLTIALGVFLAIYLSGETVQFIVIQLIIFSIPFAVLELILFFHQRSPINQQQRQVISLYKLSSSLNMMLNMLTITFYISLIARTQGESLLGYFTPISISSLVICGCFIAKTYLHSFRCFYLTQKIILGILFSLYLILSLLYLNEIPENNKETKERPVNMWEFVFIYILILISNVDQNRNKNLAKPRKYVYFSGAFALPLVNSVALAVVLILKADTGKQSLDLRLIVLISGSVILFSWFVIQMSAYWLDKKEKIVKDPESDQVPLTGLEKLKMTEEQLKVLNEVCELPFLTVEMVMKHMLHHNAGLSCQEVKCPLSDESDEENQSYDAIKEELSLVERRGDQVPLTAPEKLKMTKEQLKFLNKVCERQDQTMDMVVIHMLHHRAGLSCQNVNCPLPAMCSSEATPIVKDPESDQPKVTKEQLKFLDEVCECKDQTMDKIVVHMFHLRVGMSCQDVKCPLSDAENQSNDGTTANVKDPESDLPKMTEEQLKFLNKVCECEDRTMDMIVIHMLHRKAGLTCQEAKCLLSDESDKENQTNDGTRPNVKDPESDLTPLTVPEKPKVTKEQLKFLNKVCECEDRTVEMIMMHMLHHKKGLSCQEAKCPFSAMCYSEEKTIFNFLRRQDSDPDQPKSMAEQLKVFDEICEPLTVNMILKHMLHHRAGKSCQDAKCPLSDAENQSNDGTTANVKDPESDLTPLTVPEKPKVTKEQLKFLNKVCECEGRTVEMIMMHMLHHKKGLSCQEAKCPFSAMCYSEEKTIFNCLRRQDSDPDQAPLAAPEKPKSMAEQLKVFDEICEPLTVNMILKHMFHHRAGKSCQDAKCPLSDAENQSNDGTTALSKVNGVEEASRWM